MALNKLIVNLLLLTLINLIDLIDCNNDNTEQNIITDNNSNRLNAFYTIEGKIIPFSDLSQSLTQFMTNTKIIVNYGQYFAFLKYYFN